MKIRNKPIGQDNPTYIIAEAGINHNGKLSIAKKLVDAAVEVKANAVKFQKRDLPSLYPKDMLENPEKYEQNFQYMLPVLQKSELSENDYIKLKEYANLKKIDFICTPFDVISAEFIYNMGIHAFKISSADLTNFPLLEFVASKDLPIIISTGMSYKDEIKETVKFLNNRKAKFAILHCRSVYPVWPRDVNLKMINWLKQFNKPVGYSGHDIGIIIPLIASSMGASIIEKHITIDKTLDGPDHKISLEPYEFKRLIRDIRIADQAMGQEQRFLLRGELMNRELFGKSLAASKNIPKGTVITDEMIKITGPAKGIATSKWNKLTGKKLNRNIKKNDFFYNEDLNDINNTNKQDITTPSFRSKWGLIARFSDFTTMLSYNPKVIEIHLAEKDFEIKFKPEKTYSQELIIHVPEYIQENLMDLCSSNENIRLQSINLINKTIQLAKKLSSNFKGIPKVIAHPGAMSMNARLDKTSLRNNLLYSLSKINTQEIELLLENLPPYPWYFGGEWKGNYFMNANEIVSICKQTKLNLVFDISHAALYCNAKHKDLYEYIKTVRPFIRHMHIADGYGLGGEGVQIGKGDINFEKIMPLFSNYTESWVPEIWRGHLNNGKDFITALHLLAKYNL